MISKRILDISCSKEVFEKEDPVYNEALYKAGYRSKVSFTEFTTTPKKKRSRTGNIIWFNPPFNSTVKTNIGSNPYP